MSKYLDLTGLTYLWSKIKAKLDNVLQAYNISTIANSSSTNPTLAKWNELIAAIDAHKTFYSINSSTVGYTGWQAYKDQDIIYFTHLVGTDLTRITVTYYNDSSIISTKSLFTLADLDNVVLTSQVKQVLGTSTTNVVSQNAITDILKKVVKVVNFAGTTSTSASLVSLTCSTASFASSSVYFDTRSKLFLAKSGLTYYGCWSNDYIYYDYHVTSNLDTTMTTSYSTSGIKTGILYYNGTHYYGYDTSTNTLVLVI